MLNYRILLAKPHALVLLGLLTAGGAIALVVGPSSKGGSAADATTVIPPTIDTAIDPDPLPPLTEFDAGEPRKQMFVGYLTPIIEAVNDELRTRRRAVLAARARLDAGDELDAEVRRWLEHMAERYRVDGDSLRARVDGLAARLDIIPVPLALAQGALESAWGTSRFAREGNNIYGLWCFEPGCGIVPARRPANATYEVATYDDVAEATRAYMHQLNSHPVYEPLRERRQAARERDTAPDGHAMAAGLAFYSAKGEEYVDMIRRTIEANDLGAMAELH